MANVADLTDKYSRMTRAHDRGARDGAINHPSSDAISFTDAEVDIINLGQTDADSAGDDQKSLADDAWEAIRANLSSLPPTFPLDGSSFNVEAQQETLKSELELGRLYRTVLARGQEYRFFKTYHRLNRDADPVSSLFSSLAFVFFILVADGVLNAYFFRDVSRDALVGGFIMAFAISLVNTSLGFLTGLLPWRYLQHRTRLHLLWAFPLLVLLFVALISFNLAVGHYRDLLLVADPESAASKLGLSLLNSPFGIREPTSWLAAIVGFGIAMLALYKGYTIFDPYPRFGRVYRRMKDAEDSFDAKIREVQRGVNEISKNYLRKAGREHQALTKRLQEAARGLDDLETSIENYGNTVASIESAVNGVLAVYRAANRQVRDRRRCPEPPYFATAWAARKRQELRDVSALGKVRAEVGRLTSVYASGFEQIKKGIAQEETNLLSREAFLAGLEKVKDAARTDFAAERS